MVKIYLITINMQVLEVIWDNFFIKLFIAGILSIMITFSDSLKILKKKVVIYCIFIILLLKILLNDDIGFILLLSCLFILCFNNIQREQK